MGLAVSWARRVGRVFRANIDMESPATSASAPALDAHASRSFRREILTSFTMPIATAMLEGGFVGVIADKVYHVHPALLAVFAAAPFFGNLSSFLWARLAHGRRKVPFIVTLQVTLLALVALVGILPAGHVGGWVLAAQVVAARVVLSGIVTVRSTVWRLNYPRYGRGRIAGRLMLVTSLTMMLASLAGGFILDANPASFRILYPCGAGIAVIGILSFSRIRVRDESDHLAQEVGAAGDASAARPGMWAVLRDDPLFTRYMGCQFLLGVGNMMIQAPVIHLVSRQLQASYAVSIGLVSVTPLLAMILTMPRWGAYLDRVHVAEFRKYQSVVWMGSHLITLAGAMLGSLPLIAVGRIVVGLGRSGGAVAWQIGHNDFSRTETATLYMGVHATLTGVRGAFAPFLGMLLYVGWNAARVPGLGWAVPPFAGIGPGVFLLSAGFCVAAGVGFVDLHRRVRAMNEA